MRARILLTLVSLTTIPAGCAVFPRDPDKPTATDVVCKLNGDLGCVIVTVDEKTPRAEVGGKVYYFCSEHCRELFVAAPEKYAGAIPGGE